MREDQERWDAKYREKKFNPDVPPDPLLKKHLRFIPPGRALDIAAGEGRNAVFLAQHGFKVDAVDISRVALSRAGRLAKSRGVKIHTVAADLDIHPIGQEKYDLILDFYFLDRNLVPRIKRGLKREGFVMFSTYLLGQESPAGNGGIDPKYLLKPNELLRLFRDFRVLFYQEGIVGQGGGRKAIATLIAQKNKPA